MLITAEKYKSIIHEAAQKFLESENIKIANGLPKDDIYVHELSENILQDNYGLDNYIQKIGSYDIEGRISSDIIEEYKKIK